MHNLVVFTSLDLAYWLGLKIKGGLLESTVLDRLLVMTVVGV